MKTPGITITAAGQVRLNFSVVKSLLLQFSNVIILLDFMTESYCSEPLEHRID